MGSFERTREFQKRMKKYALDVIDLYRKLPRSGEGRVIGNQMLRSGTSVAAKCLPGSLQKRVYCKTGYIH